ncbi:hypothetical protein ACVILJ_003712 [Bradyrhizobium diazoefficiens]
MAAIKRGPGGRHAGRLPHRPPLFVNLTVPVGSEPTSFGRRPTQRVKVFWGKLGRRSPRKAGTPTRSRRSLMAHKKLVNQSGLLLTVLLITRVGSEPNQSVTTRGSSWDNVLNTHDTLAFSGARRPERGGLEYVTAVHGATTTDSLRPERRRQFDGSSRRRLTRPGNPTLCRAEHRHLSVITSRQCVAPPVKPVVRHRQKRIPLKRSSTTTIARPREAGNGPALPHMMLRSLSNSEPMM